MLKNTRATRSNPAPISPSGDSEHNMHDQDLSFRTLYIHESPERVGSIERELIHTLDQAFYSLDRESRPRLHRHGAQSAPVAVTLDVESSPQVRDHVRPIVEEEVAQKHSKHSQTCFTANRGKLFGRHLFIRLYQSRKRTE